MHYDGDGGRHDRRFKLKARHLILAAFVLLIIAGVLHMAMLSSGASRRLEALRAAGQPTSLAELALQNKLPMGMENAAPVYESAFAAFVPPQDPNVPYVGKKGVSPDRGTPWPDAMTQAVAECLAANERCLALLHEAGAIQTCRYEYDYRQGFASLSQMRYCAQLLKLAAVCRAYEGDADGALVQLKAALALGNSLRNEPPIVAYLVRNACVALAITSLEQALNATVFTDRQLKEIGDALAATAASGSLAQAFVGERCYMIDSINDPSLMGPAGPGGAVFKFPGVRSRGIIDILDHMGACIEAAELPAVERMERFREIEKRLDDLSVFHIVAKILAPALTRVAELDLRAHAHMDLAQTALAVERYRLAKNKLPEQLEDLVPGYLDRVPVDPFDGQAIRYRRTEPGYLLWSIMEDRQDNGGKERDDVGKGEPYDLCFIVVK